MWITAGILLIGCIVASIEAPYMVKKRMIKELSFFTVILLAGITFCTLLGLGLNIPNPLDWIIAIHKPISDLVLGILE